MDKKEAETESRWSKFVSSFEDYSFGALGDIDESYLTPHERSVMFQQAAEDIKLQIKRIREQKQKDKNKKD